MLERRLLSAYHALGVGPAWAPRAAPAAEVFSEASTPPIDEEAVGGVAGRADAIGQGSGEHWSELAQRVEACRACALGTSRQRAVFGAGNRAARWMLVGEAPGAEEDRTGEPFVGRAGALLDAMLLAAGVDRNRDVYITNVLKCRPPGNRNPEPDEVARCEPHLVEQIALVRPALVVLMGRFAAQTLLRTEASIASLRGRLHWVDTGTVTTPAIVSYHPAYLLRNPADKRLAWQDWCLARQEMARLASDGVPASYD